MSSLADLSEVVGFFSYSREDDKDSRGALSALRGRIQGELRGQLGRTAKSFRLWQDQEAIPFGTLWETEIKNAAAQSVFFIPIITPTVVASPYCKFELESFLAREAELGRSDLVFPILYIDVPALEDGTRRQNDPVLSLVAGRQYADWRKLRHRDVNTTDVSEAIEQFCRHIRDALNRHSLTREERQAAEQRSALERADAARKRQEAEARRREEEARRAEAQAREREEAEQRLRDETERRRQANVETKRRDEQPRPKAEPPTPQGRDLAGQAQPARSASSSGAIGVRVSDAIIGIIGAVIAGWLVPALGIRIGTGLIGAIIDAFIGAVVLQVIVRLVTRVTTRA